MKKFNLKRFLVFVTLFLGLFTNAQNTGLSTLTTIGVTSPLFDDGIGIHVGINPSYPLSNLFSLEGQISYSHTKITSTFISGNQGFGNSVYALLGGRLYFNSEKRINRFYVNLLFGGNYNKEVKNGAIQDGGFVMGVSGGAFVELNKFNIGLSYETPQNLIFKIGYIF